MYSKLIQTVINFQMADCYLSTENRKFFPMVPSSSRMLKDNQIKLPMYV